MRRRVVVLLALTLPVAALAQSPAPTVRAHRVAEPIRIDGKLDEAVYASTPA